jgi:ribosome-binding factor A
MGVRHVPELSFLADRSGRFQARIEELMGRQRKRQKAQAAQASAVGQEAPLAEALPDEQKVQAE